MKNKLLLKEETLQDEIDRRNSIQEKYDLEIKKTWQYIYIANTFFMAVKANEIVTYVNKKVLDTMGYSLKQMISKNFFDHFVHEDDREKSRDIFHRMMAGKENTTASFECRVLTKTCDVRLIALQYMPIRDVKGNIIRTIAFGEDFSQYRQVEMELKEKTRFLEESNQALKLMVDHRDIEKRAIEEAMIRYLKTTISPYLDEMAKCKLDERGKTCLEIIRAGFDEVASRMSKSLSSKYMNLTPSEVQVAELIRQGKTSKEIAEFMYVSPSTISFHRNNLRKKFGILQKKTNLRSYLDSFLN